MQTLSITRQSACGICLLVLAHLVLAVPRIAAQVNCQCTDTLPFGSCVTQVTRQDDFLGPYPDQFPGSATYVSSDNSAYIADLSSGKAHRFTVAISFFQLSPPPVRSPGVGTTSGITHVLNDDGDFLYWAVSGSLYRTSILGEDAAELGTVALEELAAFLQTDLADETIETGVLGDIVYHPTRNTLWAVDIVNDVYFEIEESGALVIEDGSPNYFLNPKRNPLTGGAYGNTITYASVDDQEYFDIPVGALSDGRPSQVLRLHASEGDDHSIGDETGVFYLLGTSVGSPNFLSAIAYWPDACSAGQSVHVSAELNALGTDQPQLIFVSADPPTAASVADFACSLQDTSVTLTWRKTLPYTRIEIRRRSIEVAGPGDVIFEGTSFEEDPEMVVDESVPKGAYEYSAQVTSESQLLPVATCSVTVERGELVAWRRLTTEVPFAVTNVGTESIVVADLQTGDAEVLDMDLNPVSLLESAIDEALGLVIGLAYNPSDENLYWLQNDNGRHFMQTTTLEGVSTGEPVLLDTPRNLLGMSLGDISYDPEGDLFWTVDLSSNSILAYTPSGKVAEPFLEQQLSAPDDTQQLTGGIALGLREEGNVVLDFPLQTTTSRVADVVPRTIYDLNTLASLSEIFRIDLRSTTGAGGAGGLALVTIDEEQFQYVVAQDQRAVYKLRVGAPPSLNLVRFRRGDANDDGSINISDPSFILFFLFQQGNLPLCEDAADANDNESLEITDAIVLFDYLFRGGAAPPEPFTTCGLDAEEELSCEQANCVDDPGA